MKRTIAALLLAVVFGFASSASAGTIVWTDWTSAAIGHPGSASGTLTRLDGPPVGVTYSGEVTGSTQTNGGGINYWVPADPFVTNPVISNAPSSTDIITLNLASGEIVNHLHFDSPLIDPVMAIVSMGTPSLPVYYTFDQPFTLLGYGQGYWNVVTHYNGTLIQNGYVLEGIEGHGAIQFMGAVSDITWTNSPNEYWHGFTVGEPVPEPATLTLLGLGLVGVARAARRRKK